MDGCVELPSCPVCIERLDGSVTGIDFEMIKKDPVYQDEKRWNKARESCITCRQIKKYSLSNPPKDFGLKKEKPEFNEERKLDTVAINDNQVNQ